MLSLKNSLAVLRKTNALLEGHFILSSGLHSPSYVQCAKLLSNPSKANKICLSLSKKIKKKIKKIDLILSPAMGGIIIGYEIGKLLSYPHISKHFCLSLSNKVKKNFKKIDLILSPAMGGIVIGYEIGRILKKETIFCERINGKFKLRRGFKIKKSSRVLIVEDVITTGKSSLECVKLIKSSKAKLVGFACLIDRSSKNNIKIKNKKIISQVKLDVPVYKNNNLPLNLKNIPISKPGSRFIKWK